MTDQTPKLADRMIVGVPAISIFAFGDDSPSNVRRMRHWLSRGIVPHRKQGRTIIAFKDKIEQALRGEVPDRHGDRLHRETGEAGGDR